MVVLKVAVYDEIVNDIKNFDGLAAHCKVFLIEKYADISPHTLGSILSTQWKWRMMTRYKKSNAIFEKYSNEYDQCKQNGEPPGIFLRLACAHGITPTLLASCVLHHRHKPNQVRSLIKNCSLIDDRDLAYEVYLSSLFDHENGPYANTIKNCFGLEYEHRLEAELHTLDIPFINEDALRSKGYDRTPDFKLVLPIAVDGFVINWIESKASFGDKITHAGNVKDQLLSYWNRFGPGLIIYWFGYIETLNPEGDKIIVCDGFPPKESITKMDLKM